MEPIIYMLPRIEKNIEINLADINFDHNPNPKLIKFGFNDLNEQFNTSALYSNPHYKNGLDFDFSRIDQNSLKVIGAKTFKIKNFDSNFAELWEVLNLFRLLDSDQKIYTSREEAITEIISSYQKLSGSKNKYSLIDRKKKEKATLVIYRYSDIDIDENAAVQLIVNDLNSLLIVQEKNSNMIIQLFGLQTQISLEIIFFLSSLYNDAYLLKPTISSDLSDGKYLVLIGLKTIPDIKFPKIPDNTYLSSIGLKNIPNNFVGVIQCINSDTLPRKYKRFFIIKTYLDGKVYEGTTYQELIDNQNANSKKWLDTFSDLTKMKKLLDNSLKKSESKCNNHEKLTSIFSQ